ncbi:MAG: DegV family protein [Lachnospiraceae bacterium]|nr:DegV family protein [Lachnospiraceae bacterium]
MKFRICTDSTSNLTDELIDKYGIEMISGKASCEDGSEYTYYVRGRDYATAAKQYYDNMRRGIVYRTSLINTQVFKKFFEPFLKNGEDVLFMGMSSGLTGTCGAARIAAEEFMEKYPDRKCIVVDSLGASLGVGLLLIYAAKLRDEEDYTIEQTAKWLEDNRLKMCHLFTVDDLKYLRRGGRISGAAAAIGSVLNIKPFLRASTEGTIEALEKIRGRKKTLNAIIERVKETITDPENQIISVVHADCEEDGRYVADAIQQACHVKEIIFEYYDICSGTHVGPGALAVFYMADHR